MKDLVIGSICNYQPKDVACWINSLRSTGYDGDVTVLNYGGCPIETSYYLTERGAVVLKAELEGHHIVVQRFWSMYNLLHGGETRYLNVLATDVRDVVFYKNPSEYLKTLQVDKPVVVASENIRYKDEDWGRDNVTKCYPHLAGGMMEQTIYNAGVIGGYLPDVRDFLLHIYHLSLLGEVYDPQPDQAAMNILISTSPFKYATTMAKERDMWAINLGTSLADNALKYQDKLIEPLAKDISSFYIIHQWDRVSSLKPMLENKFGIVV
jgi:hypothetical protein